MKIYGVLSVTAFFCFFTLSRAFSQDSNEKYILTCTFTGLPDKTRAYLTTQEKDTVQSTVSTGDTFTFSGKLSPEGRFLFICFDSTVSKVPSKAIFVANKPIKVSGVFKQREVVVTGSKEQKEYVEFLEVVNEFNKKYLRIQDTVNTWSNKRRQAKMANDSVSYSLYLGKTNETIGHQRELQRKHAAELKKWFYSHRESVFIPWAIESYLMSNEFMGVEYTTEVYAMLPEYVKNSYYGEKLVQSLKMAAESRDISKGATIPNITVLDMNGNPQHLYDIIKNSKFTLIDCWASWCTPCRAEVPELKKILQIYKDKGLNIIGISSDKKVDNWEKAIKEDQAPWGHYLEVPSSSLFKIFDLRSIPAYILVNSKGVLLAFDRGVSKIPPFGGPLRGDALSKTLDNLLQ